MKNIYYLKALLFAAAVVLLTGCQKNEDTLPDTSSEMVPVKVGTFAAIGSTVDGITLGSVRMIAVDDASNQVVFNRFTDGENEDDTFTITGALLSVLPQDSYLLPIPTNVYGGELSRNISLPLTANTSFTENSDTYAPVVSGYLLPEYLMGTNPDAGNIPQLVLTADYSLNGGTADAVTYGPMLLRSAGADLIRNTHYNINISINKRGEFEYLPYITYEVADWYLVTDDPSTNVNLGGTYRFSDKWAAGTTLEDPGDETSAAIVNAGGFVTLEFTLAEAENDEEEQTPTQWGARLSNTSDFALEGDREGVAKVGETNEIVIRSLRSDSEVDLTTELEIYTFDGTTYKKVDINVDSEDNAIGYYVIKQKQNI